MGVGVVHRGGEDLPPLERRFDLMAQANRNRKGRPKKKTNKSATFRLPQELLDQLAAEADEQERSQTTLVRRALEAYLAKQAAEDRE